MTQPQHTSGCETVGKTFQMLKQICGICALDCQAQTEVWRSDFKWSKLSKYEIEDRRKQWIELLTREKGKSEEKGKQTLADKESQERQRLWCKELETCKAEERKEGTPLVGQVQFYNLTRNSSEFLAIPSRERLRYLVVRPEKCSMCHERLYIRADIRELPCKHIFYSNCIRGHLALGNNCPFCHHEYHIVRTPLFRQTGFCNLPMRRLWAWLHPSPGRWIHQFFQNMNNLELRCWGEEPDPLEDVSSVGSEVTKTGERKEEVPTLLDREKPWDLIIPELAPPLMNCLLVSRGSELDIFVTCP
jgi:hypothetical protein